MVSQKKRVFYVKYIADPVFQDILSRREDVLLDRLENEVADGAAAPILEAAHVYQVGASRDELPVRFHVDAKLIARMPNLLIASSNGAGYDPINVADCTKAGIAVVNQAGGNARSVAEHVVGMMIVLSKRIVEADRALRRGCVDDRNAYIGSELLGKTIGIVGLGHAGGQVARICGAFGLQVIAYDPYLDADNMTARGARKVDFDTLLRSSDFVSVNCPLNAETRGMIGEREFGLMQRHAIFVTAARGFIHNENALAVALRSKAIAGAGLDVWAQEPPPHEHPLLDFDTVIVSPHTAGVTVEARKNMGRIAAEQILAALTGRCPPRLVNPECWPHYSKRFERIFGFLPDPLGS